MSTTTPPPLDDREKVARGLAEHESNWQSDGDYCERTWIECRCGETWDVPTIEQEWEAARRHQADAVLAVLDLPARDRDTARAALGSLQSFARECMDGEHGEIDAEAFSGWHHMWAAAMQHRVIHYPHPDTTHDFEAALVAKHPDGRVAVRIDTGKGKPWGMIDEDGYPGWFYDPEMPDTDFIPAIPVTTPREGYEAAWDLAYVLPEDAVIPAGTPYIVRWHDGGLNTLPEGVSYEVHAHVDQYDCRLLDAPAPARPEGAEEIESQIEAWVFSEDGAALDAKHLRTLADRIAREAGR